MKAGCDEACDVGHIYPKDGTDLIGDFTEALEIDYSRVSGGTGNDHLRMALEGDFLNLIVIDIAFGVDTIGYDMEVAAGEVDR